MSEQKPIRGSLFGGFNKKDVAGYVEELSKKSAELRAENEQLHARCEELEDCRSRLNACLNEFNALREEFDSAMAQIDTLNTELAQLREEKEMLTQENSELKASLTSLNNDVEVYHAAKERLAALEIESSRRSLEIERSAKLNAASTINAAKARAEEMQAALENLRRDSIRMKDSLRAQLTGLESSLDDIATLSSGKKEFLGKYTANGEQEA